MRRTFDSRLTMFVYIKGHALLQFYLLLKDSQGAANDDGWVTQGDAETAERTAP